MLNVVDDVTRECLAAIPDTSISGRRVARELTALIERRGKPGQRIDELCALPDQALVRPKGYCPALRLGTLHSHEPHGGARGPPFGSGETIMAYVMPLGGGIHRISSDVMLDNVVLKDLLGKP